MKTIRNFTLYILHFTIVFAAALSGVAKTFDVDISTGKPAASNEAYYHGETIEFRAVRGRSVVTNIEYAAIYYQTNGMGDAWWKTDGLVFHPTNDVGAASYRFFLEGREIVGSSRDWHANGLLRLLDSPGFEPSAVELPVAQLDFANIEVFNAPYYTKDETDDLIDYSPANSELAATIAEVAPAPELSEHGGFSDWDIIPKLPGTVSAALKLENGKWYLWMQQSGEDVRKISSIGKGDENSTSLSWDASETGMSNFTATRSGLGRYYVYGDNADKPIQPAGEYAGLTVIADAAAAATNYTDAAMNALADVAHSGSYNDLTDAPSIPSTVSNIVTKAFVEDLGIASEETDPTVSSWAKQPAKPNYTASEVGAASASELSELADEVAPAVNGYARLYSFTTGSTNANFAVTNYQLTAEAEATRTHFDPSDPDLDFSTVPSSLRLEDASSGTNRVVVDTRDWVVWYYTQKIVGAVAEAVSTAVDTCRAWVNFTASGLENPVPDTLIVDVPNIWLMAGKTFEKHIAGSNAVWIIRSKDAVVPISDNAQSAGGFLELTDAFGTPYIRFNKTESYFVDPVEDGVSFDRDAGEWQILYSTTNCPKGGANAVLEGSTTYPGKAVLKAEDDPDCPATITWTGSANNWVMHAVPKLINGAVPPKMFFAAVVEVQGQDYIEYLRPMSIPKLIVDDVKIAPEIPASHPVGTTVPWKVVE